MINVQLMWNSVGIALTSSRWLLVVIWQGARVSQSIVAQFESPREILLLHGIEETGHVTVEHGIINLLLLLVSLFF